MGNFRYVSLVIPYLEYTKAMKKKKNGLFLLSVTLNILFLLVVIFLLPQRGESSYLFRNTTLSQSTSPTSEPVKFSAYYLDRKSLFEVLPKSENDIIFLGDSLTNRAEWSELFETPNIKNRGINGDNTYGILKRLDQITTSLPEKIFVMIGINDLIAKEEIEKITYKYRLMLKTIKQSTPNTQVFVQSVLPVNNSSRFIVDNKQVIAFNDKLKRLSEEFKYEYVDLYSVFSTEIRSLFSVDSQLTPNYTNDGIHLNGEGYLLWKQTISKYLD